MNGWVDFDEILCDGQLYPGLGAYYRHSLNFQGGFWGGRAPQTPELFFSTKYSVCAIFRYIKPIWIERGYSSECHRRGFKSIHGKTGAGEPK